MLNYISHIFNISHYSHCTAAFSPSVFIFLIICLTQTRNGHITCTLRHTVLRKGKIFHWPPCRWNVMFSQGQQSSAGGLGRESQLKSSNSMRMNTHGRSVHGHALSYISGGREANGLCSVSGMPQVTASDCRRSLPVSHSLDESAAPFN